MSGVIERNFLSLEFAGALGESGGEVVQEKFAKYLMAVGEHLNSESIGKQFTQSDVYDGTQVILNQSRIPGSRGKGKDNDREGKGARREGRRRESNLANGGANPEKVVIINFKRSLGIGNEIIIKISGVGGQTADVLSTGRNVEPPSDLDWEE